MNKTAEVLGEGGLTALTAKLGPQGLKGLEATGPVECLGYRLTLTPWWCILNQLSDFCLPGFPCETCEAGVGIRAAGGDKDHRLEACATNQKPKTKNQKLLLKGMTRAVARDLGMI